MIDQPVECTPFHLLDLQEVLFLTIRSNLATQVFVFQDEALTLPVENVRLAPGGKLQVHVCVQPSLKGDSLTRGNCRELVGGLKIRGAVKFVSIYLLSIIYNALMTK